MIALQNILTISAAVDSKEKEGRYYLIYWLLASFTFSLFY
jgi:hypothetical protein